MSFDQRLWSSTESTGRPMILALRLSNCGFSFAMVPSSVVQTGVKSFGCENKTAQELPIQSWNRIRPSVVSASKSGAVSPIFISCPPPFLKNGYFKFRRLSQCPCDLCRRFSLRDQLAELFQVDVAA